MIKQIVTTVKAMPIFESIYILFVTKYITSGKFTPTTEREQTFLMIMDEVYKSGISFRELRNKWRN
jgi:hypothetical protein